MKRVVIESPFNAPTQIGIEENILYAKRCVRDSLGRGEAPYASHLFFTRRGILDDSIPAERALGIAAGFAWGEGADLVAVYMDRSPTLSSGMRAGIAMAKKRSIPIEVRAIDRSVTNADRQAVADVPAAADDVCAAP